MKKLKLQVFKTQSRGWGVRTLVDMPQGNHFIKLIDLDMPQGNQII